MPSLRTKYRKISTQISSGKKVRVGKGIYADPQDLEGLEGDFYRATLLCGKPSLICLLSALKFHGLSEQVFGGTWILLPYNSYLPRKKVLRAVRSRRPFCKTGIISTPKFKITNIEKTIVDCFRYQRLVGVSTAIEALKIS